MRLSSPVPFTLLLVIGTAIAQTPSKQAALDAIAARANDSAHPQSLDTTLQQLREFTMKYGGTVATDFVNQTGVPGHGVANPMTSCGTHSPSKGHTCRLVKAEVIGGRLSCTYVCD